MRRTVTIGLVAFAVAIALWQGLIWIFGFQKFILPRPHEVLESLWRFRLLIAENMVITLTEIVAGLAIGVALGVGTAIQLASSPIARDVMRPLLVFMQAVPIFALAPILVIWFGFGIWPKIFVVVIVCYFPVTSAFFDGLTTTPRGFTDLARTMGASGTRTLLLVRVPAALPSLCSGLRLAAVYAPIGAFIGEWVGASKGLGAMMVYANARGKIDMMFAALVVLAILTVVLHAGMDRFCRWLTARYS